MLGFQPVLVLRIAVPVFVSLVAIRLFARVLRAVFPASALARLVERTISWLAWIGAVLWIVGLLPPVLAELDADHAGLRQDAREPAHHPRRHPVGRRWCW